MKTLIALLFAMQLSAVEIFGVDWSQSDKQGHFWLGAGSAAVGISILDHFSPEARWYTKMATGIGSAALVGAIKEYADGDDPLHHTVDFKDFLATTYGGVAYTGGILLLDLTWRF